MRGGWIALVTLTLGTAVAPMAAQEAPRTDTVYVIQRPYRSPGSAGLLSTLLIGTGQAYNGEWGKGVAFVGAAIMFAVGSTNAADGDQCAEEGDCTSSDLLAAGFFGTWALNIIDAVRSAKRLNAQAVSVAPLIGPRARVGVGVSVPVP